MPWRSVDVVVDVLLQVLNNGFWQIGQGPGVNTFVKRWAGRLKHQARAEQRRRQGFGVLNLSCGMKIRRADKERVGVKNLGGIGQTRCSEVPKTNVPVIANVSGCVFLVVAPIGAAPD